MSMTVWAIVGTRDYSTETKAKDVMRKFLTDGDIVVSGGARGPDSWAKEVADELEIPCKEFLADWETHGKQAGIIRNTDIVNACDRALAFWDGLSKGTLDTIKKATRAGKVVIIVGPSE